MWGECYNIDRWTIEIEEQDLFNIPPEISQLSDLKELNLENCQLKDNISSVIDKLVNLRDLKILKLKNNELTGQIPANI